ncbi:MAG: bifunctional phosphopantothenoylcysteine decarboxylase/phosphopantothenate--cysteine ligase CoaBC [Clostridia bacterium]|nr:bifunctional phosphopantothenoylcysteine decarboxylase/phosphopantothenate--cysteine ligase CoaBC [Clostridia bacterium]
MGITGSIAAYKACDIVSSLKKSGVDVHVILTAAGEKFITPLTLETLSGNPVITDMFNRETPWEVEHISLAKKADVFLIAPCSADIIGKMANGIADDMLSTTVMATAAPVVIAPAMNSAMYLNAFVQKNMNTLKEHGCIFIEPEEGLLACGDKGVGRLADTAVIKEKTLELLNPKNDLKGKKILVTAGPTVESIDPVRYITNRSSGKMGFAIAEAAQTRGADVTLITGPVSQKTPSGVNRIDIVSSAQLCAAVVENFKKADALIMAAAPADFTPETVYEEKLKKDGSCGLELKLVRTKDILKTVSPDKGERIIMGFAAETHDHEQNAVKKLNSKGLDFIALNDVSNKNIAFGSNNNAVTLYSKDGSCENSGVMSKGDVAHWLLDRLFAKQ